MNTDLKINLVQDGIFPLKGNTETDSTGFETTGTLQGEGKLLGTPCIFIRTSGCNLRCSWIGADGNGSPCDTPYSSHNPEKNMQTVGGVLATIEAYLKDTDIKHIVVSGGEPTIQREALGELLEGLTKMGYHTTIETNGTIYTQKISKYTNLVSISPKLSTSTPWKENLKNTGIEYSEKWANRHERLRINIDSIQRYIDDCYFCVEHPHHKNVYVPDYTNKIPGKDFQLKFVVSKPQDFEEIKNDILHHLAGVKPSDVCIMPEGVDSESLATRTQWASEMAIKYGYSFTPRLHIMMWGNNRYV